MFRSFLKIALLSVTVFTSSMSQATVELDIGYTVYNAVTKENSKEEGVADSVAVPIHWYDNHFLIGSALADVGTTEWAFNTAIGTEANPLGQAFF